MASILDFSLFGALNGLMVFLFVWTIVYAILTKTKFPSDHPSVNAMIAFTAGIMVVAVPNMSEVVALLVPWFTLIFIFALLVILLLMMFGATEENIKSPVVGSNGQVLLYWIIIISVLIFLGVLGKVFFTGQEAISVEGAVEQASIENGVDDGAVGGQGTSALFATLFHPKVLGAILIFLIAALTIKFIARE
ncbi:hypothetical protein GOV04_01970 [Candidatus Woesearchaeota archaeon]|nr:hypothetical protein [Candidatus Woesearchaeota archaeon]